MGFGIPQVITETKASGAQVIDGSLKFDDDSSHYLNRTPSSAGNTKTWTWSCWVKRSEIGSIYPALLSAGSVSSDTGFFQITVENDEFSVFMRHSGGTNYAYTNAKLRDISAWYHLVVAMDTTAATEADRLKMYVNGVEQTFRNSSIPAQDRTFLVNGTALHQIGATKNIGGTTNAFYAGYMADLYLIDGQALGPENFGFTDGLTNTWRPKKYTGTYGTNSFYLPMDGNSPIGQDQSGKGNNWTPVNFGGSNTIEKATGALPILNTVNGGNVARPGVFGSEVGFRETVSSSSGGGNPYIFDTRGTQPVLSFIRGATYVFDYSSATSHPLRFATAADAAGSTEYTDGTSVSGNVISFTVPHNAPDTLYYYCTNHSGMGNSISVTTDETKADPYAWKCVLAMPLIGNGDDASDQVNSTSSAKTTVTSGSPAVDKISNLYGSSIDFTASSTTGYYISGTQSDFTFGTGDFTIEFWFKPTTTSRQYITDFRNNGSGGTTGNKPFIIFADNGSDSSGTWIRYGNDTSDPNFDLLGGNGLPTSNTWHHLAIVRSSGTVYGYLNGALTNSATDSRNYTDETSVVVGNAGAVTLNFDGSLQDYRVYKGVAKYTSNFIPASSNPDILPDTPSGVATKTQLTKITDGAVAFTGGNKTNLLVPNSTDLDFGTANFTVECYLYMNSYGSTGSYPSFLSEYSSPGGSASWIFRARNTGTVIWYSGGSNNESSTKPMVLGKWLHLAAVREGTGSNQMKVYVDGKLHLTTTDATNYASGNGTCIGSQDTDNTNTIDGFVSNVRILKGTALYTSEFTPPSEPLTNVTNTKLLCCQSNKYSGHYTVCPTPGGINDGDIWSDSTLTITTAGTTETGTLGAVFNATTGTTGAVDSFGYMNGAFDFTWTPRAAIPYTNKVEVWTGYGGNVSLNGGSNVSTTSNNWTELVSGSSGNITSIRFTTGSGGGWWSGVRVDDVMLVDPIFTNGQAKSSNFNPFTTDINTVRGQEGSYATLNPLDSNFGSNLQDGNLKAVGSSNWSAGHARGNIALTSGKWFWESTYSAGSSTLQFGFANTSASLTESYGSVPANSWTYYFPNSSILFPSGGVSNYFGAGASLGDTIGCALDMDNGTWQFFKNGVGGTVYTLTATDSGSTASITELYPLVGSYNGTQDINFGQKPFKFPPPDGFQPLTSSTARPDTVIARPDQYVSVDLWTGTSATRTIETGTAPDFVWIKQRNNAGANMLFDSVRGATKRLVSNQTLAEGTVQGVTDFLSNGYQLGNDPDCNWTDKTHVGWSWKAGGNKNTFNVDDVGYANASDVNMNVGGLNSSAYDQSQTWSNNLAVNTGSISNTTQAFNGNLTNGADSSASTGSNDRRMTATLGLTLNNETVEVYPNHTYSGYYATIDGVAQPIQYFTATNGFQTMGPFTGTLTSVTVTNGTESSQRPAGIRAIRVGGKILVDNGITPPDLPTIAATGASVGTKQGFSIIKYDGNGTAGSFIPHGLSQIPKFVIVKDMEDSDNWQIYHEAAQTSGAKLLKFTTAAASDNTGPWNNTAPTSKLISLGGGGTNDSGNTHTCYAWHDVPGLQKFGSYTGNASANPFIELGFRPALLWIKNTSSSSTDWVVIDSQRQPFNQSNLTKLYISSANSESTIGVNSQMNLDFLSNGFKLRDSNNKVNASGDTYVYCAWATAPSVDLYGGGANAR